MHPQLDIVAPSPEFPAEADTVVIGGGIAGVTAALELAERGQRVALVEKGEIAAEQSCRNWGWVRCSGRDRAEFPLGVLSLSLWDQMAQRTGRETGFRRTGVVYTAYNKRELRVLEQSLANCRDHGINVRWMSPSEFAEFMPQHAPPVLGALHTPDDGRAEPSIAVPAMARAAQDRGVALLTRYINAMGLVQVELSRDAQVNSSGLPGGFSSCISFRDICYPINSLHVFDEFHQIVRSIKELTQMTYVSNMTDTSSPVNRELAPPLLAGRATLSMLLVVFVAVNLRPLLTSVAPLVPDIQKDLSLSSFWISVLVTIPVICLGVFGPLAAVLNHRMALESAILLALCTAFIGAVLRSFGIVPLYVGTIFIGGSMSILSILTPVLIRRDFPGSVGMMMGVFAMVLGLGAAVSAASAVPIRNILGGWQSSLLVWVIPVVIAAFVALAMLRLREDEEHAQMARRVSIMHDPISWQLAIFFALIASSAYAVISWGPSMLADRGLDPKSSGFLMSLFFLAQMPSGFLTPVFAGRMRDQRLLTSLMVLLSTFGLIAFLFAPTWSLAGVAVIVGIGQGGGFAMALTLIVLRSGSQHVAARLSSVVQSVGYVGGGFVGPFAVGLLHDLTGDWAIIAWFYAAVGVVSLAFGYGASRNRLISEG
ncbi:FAD-dependent oxidoreductase [Mangrovicoccus ximenensis]|uniref:FAD-dependent oxidoreductase n=1 Tax=Mangrovicoccus ximenensis TaxID=1911570 RepID=UPI0011AE6842|nr:FAD-dependent oxidoreductase [Mangrovicoccus ximenensis]